MRLLCVLAALALAAAARPGPAPFTPPPAPTRWVTDTAGFIRENTRESLDARLQSYERETGHQVIVWIGRTTGKYPLEDWATRTFNTWGIGRKDRNDGVALFVFSEDRKLRIAVGLGLEDVLTNAICARIVLQIAVPTFRAAEPDGAIVATVDARLEHLSRAE